MTENWTAADLPDLTGRTAVVTGAGGGLGRLAARALGARGARVISVVREAAQAQPGTEPEVADLADLDAVRDLATRLHARHGRIDLLLNNAGVMGPRRTLSRQGHELQFAVNHLAHFALTGLLLDLLEAAPAARVVTVTSVLHRQGTIRFADLDGERRYAAGAFYNQSKLANAVFGLELQRRLAAAGSTVSSLLAHPGFARTGLQAKLPPGLYRTLLINVGIRFFAQDADQGVLPLLYAAAAPGARGGQLIGPGGRGELRGAPAVVQPSGLAADEKLGTRLWELSEELTGVAYDV